MTNSHLTQGLLGLFGASLAGLRSPRLDVVALGEWRSSTALGAGAETKSGDVVGR